MLIFISISVLVVLLFLFYASYNINSGVYIKALCRAKRDDKVVALTFDDGPDPVQTIKVLDVLKEFNAKACFFCIGHKVEKNQSIIRRIIDEGHLIGNHSYSHFFSFPLHSCAWLERDIVSCKQSIEQAVNVNYRLFRPPFGVTNPMVAKSIKRLNYITIGWSIRSLDTCKTMEKTMARIKRKLHPGAVVLLHDPLPTSDELVRNILIHLQENGYRVERVDTLFDLKLTEL